MERTWNLQDIKRRDCDQPTLTLRSPKMCSLFSLQSKVHWVLIFGCATRAPTSSALSLQQQLGTCYSGQSILVRVQAILGSWFFSIIVLLHYLLIIEQVWMHVAGDLKLLDTAMYTPYAKLVEMTGTSSAIPAKSLSNVFLTAMRAFVTPVPICNIEAFMSLIGSV